MAIYPPTVSTWGANAALTNQLTTIAYTGIEGSIFHLSGPFAPIPGAQDGVVLTKHMGLMSPFEMLDLRGARQDGATWTDAVYDVGEIMLGLEVSGIAPQNMRDVMRYWIGAWDPKIPGTLSVFTPDFGEWWCNVRMGKNISDMFEKDFTYSGRQPLIWSAKNYDAFWRSADSVSEFNLNANQTISFGGFPTGGYFTLTVPGASTSQQITYNNINAAGVYTALTNVMGTTQFFVTDTAGGPPIEVEFTGTLGAQAIGTMTVNNQLTGAGGASVPITVTQTAAGGSLTGFVPLTNIGDQPGWPRFLCYGPGTFYLGNGPLATQSVVFGPLTAGQVVLVTTYPRLRSVVDLTPSQPPPPSTQFQTFLAQLISFATNNNVPPLLQQFESRYGILPPQGNLYSLMNGRFTVPLAPTAYGVPPSAQYIPVQITGGNSSSQIIAAVTPMRRWPL